VSKQHYGAIAAVLVGFVVCRVLSVHVVSAIGSMAGHNRPAGTAIGAVVGLFPVAVFFCYAVLRFQGSDVEHKRWLRVLAVLGWIVAGGVLGILPYSRFGTETDLLYRYRGLAPGFLHALDVVIVVDLAITAALLLISLRLRDPYQPPPAPEVMPDAGRSAARRPGPKPEVAPGVRPGGGRRADPSPAGWRLDSGAPRGSAQLDDVRRRSRHVAGRRGG